MKKYVIFKEFGKLKMTSVSNYSSTIRDANKVTDLSAFADFDAAAIFLTRFGTLNRNHLIDKTND